MSIRSLVVWFVCTLTVAGTPLLRAQRANGPYATAFGPQVDENRIQGLDLSGMVLSAYDDNLLATAASPDLLDPALKVNGTSSGFAGSLIYDRRGDRVHVALNGSGMARQYAFKPDLLVGAYQGNASLSASIASRLVLEARGTAQYSPFFGLYPIFDSSIGPVGSLGPGFGFAAVAERNAQMDAAVRLTSHVTKQTSLFASIDGRDWRVLDAPDNNLLTWGGRAGVRHRLSRTVGLHFEYGRDQNQYAFASGMPVVNQTIDAGVDYGDTLSFARRTAFSFSTSTAVIHYFGETHYRLNGSARLTRGFNRTWSSWVGYNRNTEFNIGFRAPLLADSIDAGLTGQMSWRVRWSTFGGYTKGTVGFASDDFSTYSGTSRLELALTRKLAVFGQYIYYHYNVPPGSSVVYLVPRLSRQAGMIGLSISMPLINDVRAPREPKSP